MDTYLPVYGQNAPPQHCMAFPKTRYYMRQLVRNPKRAMKSGLHAVVPFAVSDPPKRPKDIDALKRKAAARKAKLGKIAYKKERFLTAGGFGKIYKGKFTLYDDEGVLHKDACALKVLSTNAPPCFGMFGSTEMYETTIQEIDTELTILKALKGHPFIMEYLFDRKVGNKIIIGTEFCSHHDLADILDKSTELRWHPFTPHSNQTTPRFECETVRFVLAPIFAAVAYMNEVGYVHKDIKPQNILVDARGIPKLCDFGLAVGLAKSGVNEGDRDAMGSSYYMAPETISHTRYNESLDTWQMGISMLVLAYGWGPYHYMKQNVDFENTGTSKSISFQFKKWSNLGMSDYKMYNKRIRKMLRISGTDSLESEEDATWIAFRKFIGALMIFDPIRRPSCARAAQHEYIAKPLAEWNLHHFDKFKPHWKKWNDILEACD